MRRKHLGQGFRKILQQMKTVSNLHCLGRALASTLRIRLRAVTCDDLYARMLPEPLRHGVGRAIWEESHRLAAFQIYQDGPIRLAFPEGEIIHPEHGGRGERRGRLPTEQAQQGVPAHGQTPALAQANASLAAQGEAHRDKTLSEPQRAPRPGGGDRRQPFGEDATAAGTIAAEPLADAELEAHAVRCPRQIGQGPCVTTVDTPRGERTQRTGHVGLRRVHQERDLCRRGVDVTGGKA